MTKVGVVIRMWLLGCLRLQMSPKSVSPKSVSPKDNKSKAAFGRRESTRPSKYAHYLTFSTSKEQRNSDHCLVVLLLSQ